MYPNHLRYHQSPMKTKAMEAQIINVKATQQAISLAVLSKEPAGQCVHKPVIITKSFDKSSPLLANALSTGEKLNEVTIKWFRTSATGTQEHDYTTKLTDAILVEKFDHMPHCQDSNMADYTHMEELHFSYRAIEWTHEACGTSRNDDWRKPVSA